MCPIGNVDDFGREWYGAVGTQVYPTPKQKSVITKLPSSLTFDSHRYHVVVIDNDKLHFCSHIAIHWTSVPGGARIT